MNADSDRLPSRGSPWQAPQAAGRWSRQTVLAVSLTVAVCFAGMGLLLRATRLGPIVWTDSILYLTGAGNWLAGLGLSWATCDALKPSTVYAPLFPLMLAGLNLLGIDPLQAGRAINIAAYGLSGILVAAYSHRTLNAPFAGAVAALLFLVAPGISEMHLALMTDGPYLAFCLITLLFLAAYAGKERIWLLSAAGAAAGLAFLTRYIGSALVLSGLVCLALRSRSLRSLIREALVFGGISLTPIIIWYGRNLNLTGYVSAYRILPRPIDSDAVFAGIRMTADWLLPGFILSRLGETGLALLASAALVCLLICGVWLVLRVRRVEPGRAGDSTHALFASVFLLIYMGMYFGSVLVVFPPPTISERYLAPGYSMVVLLMVMAAVPIWRKGGRVCKSLLLLTVAVLVWNKAEWSRGLLMRVYDEGVAYTSVGARNSETIAGVRELDPDLIYSNDVTAITFLAGRPACNLPNDFHVSTAEVDWNDETPDAFRDRMAGPGTVLVLFNRAPWETYREVTDGLVLYREYADGRIYVGDASQGN